MEWFEQKADLRMGALFQLSGLEAVPIDDLPELSVRAHNCLRRADIRTVGDLTSRTVGSLMALRNFGVTSLESLTLSLAELIDGSSVSIPEESGYVPAPWDRRADDVGAADEQTEEYPRAMLPPDVRKVIAWAFVHGRGRKLGELLSVGLPRTAMPSEVDAAVKRLDEIEVADAARAELARLDPVAALRDAAEHLPQRERLILESRNPIASDPPTLEDLGDRFGITRERVRQLYIRADRTFRSELAGHPVLAEALDNAPAVFGHLIRLEDRVEVTARAIPTLHYVEPEEAYRLVTLLLGSVGHYQRRGDWLMTSDLAGVLDGLPDRAGAQLLVQQVDAELEALGLRLSDVGDLLDELGLEVFAGCVIRAVAGIVERARILLRQAGSPLKADEVHAALGVERSLRSVRNALTGSHELVRVDRSEFGLPEWGLEEYSTVADAIAAELEAAGEALSVNVLARRICDKFSVSASSVRAYAFSDAFARTADGLIRIRHPHEQLEDDHPPLGQVGGCCRVGDRWALRIAMDEKNFKGFSPTVPAAFAAHLGARPMGTREVRTEEGHSLSVVRSALQCNIGRLREPCQQLGLAPGDVIFVVAADGGGDPVELVPLTKDEMEGVENTLVEVALMLRADEPTTSALASAIGLPPDASTGAVVARLRFRGEERLAKIVERSTDGGDELDAPDGIARLLGL